MQPTATAPPSAPTPPTFADPGRASAITSAYQQYLGRTPDAQGLQNWYNSADLTPDQIGQQLAGSSEGKSYADNQAFKQQLSSLYQPVAPQAPVDNSATQNALGAYTQALGSQQDPMAILQGREQALGIPQAQQQVSGLRQAITNTTNLLNSIPASIAGRTANSLVTQAQATQMTNNTQAPIQQNLNGLGQQYSQASGDLNQLNTQAMNETNLANTGQQQKLAGLQQVYQNQAQQAQQAESTRQFNQSQATAQAQFLANLAVNVKQFNLSKAQQEEAVNEFNQTQAETQRQFNAKQAADAQQNAITNALEQAKLAETVRNDSITAKNGGSGTSIVIGGGSTGVGTGNGTTAPAATMTQRNDGGYSFTTPSGQAISAGSYATATGQPIATVLRAMGQAGDTYAQKAYTQIQNNQGYYAANPDILKSEFSPLFWGT